MNRVEVGILDYSKFEHRIETYVHCLRRYQFAAQFVNPDDTVLDLCCGSGYGTDILKRKAARAVGIDIRQDMIEYAADKYPKCEFIIADVNLYENYKRYDVITMFECIEHLDRVDSQNLIGRMAEACSRVMMVSFPCDAKLKENPYHKTQWDEWGLTSIMEKHFKSVIVFGQSWCSGLISYPYDENRSYTVVVGIKS